MPVIPAPKMIASNISSSDRPSPSRFEESVMLRFAPAMASDEIGRWRSMVIARAERDYHRRELESYRNFRIDTIRTDRNPVVTSINDPEYVNMPWRGPKHRLWSNANPRHPFRTGRAAPAAVRPAAAAAATTARQQSKIDDKPDTYPGATGSRESNLPSSPRCFLRTASHVGVGHRGATARTSVFLPERHADRRLPVPIIGSPNRRSGPLRRAE